MGRYVDLYVPDDTIGIAALRRIAAEGPKRHSLGIVLDAGYPVKPGFLWNPIFKDGRKVGDLTNCIFSYRLKKNIGFALIDRSCAIGDPGRGPDRRHDATRKPDRPSLPVIPSKASLLNPPTLRHPKHPSACRGLWPPAALPPPAPGSR